MIKGFQELKVWQKAHVLVLDVYHVTCNYPQEERYALVTQMRRSAVSVPANIAEGSRRRSTAEFVQFVSISQGSLEELKYYFLLSRDLGYISHDKCRQVLTDTEEVGAMLNGLAKSLERRKQSVAVLRMFLFGTLLLTAYRLPLTAAEVTPYFNASLLGGQYFFGDNEGALSGNASVLTSAALKFSPAFTLVPLYSGRYQGTKQVADMAGGGTLFQALMNHRVALKGIYSFTPSFRIKPEAGFKHEFLRETRDEKWGKGLFDYQRPGFSIETEYTYRDPFTVRAGYDIYKISFLNYTSLESQIGETEGSLARELAGARVLDSLTHNVYVAGSREMPWRSLGEAYFSFTMRGYGEQRVVNETGQFDSDARKDAVMAGNLSWRFPRRLKSDGKIIPGLTLTYVRSDSNQNSYDAQRTKFIGNYYDYDRLGAGLNASLQIPLEGEKRFWDVRLGLGYTRVNYTGRPVQDSAGLYMSDKIYLNELTAGGSVSYPVVRNFRWTASLQYGKQSSNMRYEKLFRYNFNIFTYLMGFAYEY
ncbi:MAG: four helix bundle protein [bacterium]